MTHGCAHISQITECHGSVPHLHSLGIPSSAGREQERLSPGAELTPRPTVLWKHEAEETAVKLSRTTSWLGTTSSHRRWRGSGALSCPMSGKGC